MCRRKLMHPYPTKDANSSGTKNNELLIATRKESAHKAEHYYYFIYCVDTYFRFSLHVPTPDVLNV